MSQGLPKLSKGRAGAWAASGAVVLSILTSLALGGASYLTALGLMLLGPGLAAFIRRSLAAGSVQASLILAAIPWLAAIPFLSHSLGAGSWGTGPLMTATLMTISLVWISALSGLLGHFVGMQLHGLILWRWPRLLVLMPIRAPLPKPKTLAQTARSAAVNVLARPKWLRPRAGRRILK